MAEEHEVLSAETAARLEKVFAMVGLWRERTRQPSPQPAERSSLAADDATTKPHALSHAAVGAMVSAVDHMDALRVLIQDAHVLHARAPYTLLRAALENAALAVWLLAPASRNDRVYRSLRLEWADENDHVQALRLMEAPTDDRLSTTKAKLREIATRRGLPDEAVVGVAARPVAWGTIVEAAGEEGNGLTGRDAKWCWTIGSGIAHARSWASLAVLERTDNRVTTGDVVNVEITASEPALLAMAECAALMIAEGWRLFDQRRQVHVG